jgi:hypothetical protein
LIGAEINPIASSPDLIEPMTDSIAREIDLIAREVKI